MQRGAIDLRNGLIILLLAAIAPAVAAAGETATDPVFRRNESEGTGEAGPSFPYLDVGVLIEIENDNIYKSGDPGAEINDLFTTTEPVFALHLLPGLFVEAGLVLEPVMDPMPFEDRFFADHGLYVEVLSLNFEGDGFALVGGKFTPAFGIAWDRAPGIYGADFAEDYELTERIGFGGAIDFGADSAGRHRLSASTFFVDTSVLSNSVITERGRVHRTDGGPGNTGDLSSFAVALDGGEIPGLDGLSYHAAIAYQDVSQPGEDAELGLVFGADWTGALGRGVEIAPIIEVAYFDNADGVRGQDRVYLTAGVGAGYEGWNAAISFTGRTTTMPGDPDVDDRLVQVSAGYLFDFGLAVDAGWAWVREDGTDTYLAGVLLAYEFGSCLGCVD